MIFQTTIFVCVILNLLNSCFHVFSHPHQVQAAMIPATTMGAMDLQDMEQPATGQLATELAAMELGMDLVLITIQV